MDDENVENFKQAVFSSSPYTLPTIEVQTTMRLKLEQMYKEAQAFDGGYQAHPLGENDEDEGLG